MDSCHFLAFRMRQGVSREGGWRGILPAYAELIALGRGA